GEIIEGRTVIVATGSTPTNPATEGFDSKGVITTDEALALEEAPARLLILGGGPIGVEFAAIFHGVGSRVTLLEPGPQILPGEDHEVGQRVRQSLRDRGIDVLIKTAPTSIRQQEGEELVVSLGGRSGEVSVDKVLTTGRAPCLVDLGLTEVGVRLAGGAIVVDDGMRTNVPGLFAIGDATGGQMLSHLASVQGLVAAENAMGRARRMDYRAVPRCLHTDPEVGCVGLTEAQAEEQGYQFKTSTIPFTLSARATTLGELEGAVKIVAEARYGKILGVHIIGPQATELIGEAALAIQLEATAEDLAYAIRAHPTLAESQVEAARDILGQAIYLPKW
ncbi:MAG: NAD(P)/FAD-dependent oxidoreductase, partial [Chloroflexi bacterium]|nr:NAD(P)/FAD-dependent oxidoreductase [Chloroflexota bacterium]